MIDTEALRKKVIDLAIQGKLTEQLPSDGDAESLYAQIQEEKEKRIKSEKLKKEKEMPSITERNIPFDIPCNWKWVYMGEIFDHNTGKALNNANKDGLELEYITTSNMYWDHFELDGLKSMYFKESEIEKCTIKKGDLLICEGGDIGRSAIWAFDYDMRIQNHIHRLRGYGEIEHKFYFYIMRNYKDSGLIDGRGIGLQGFSSKRVHSLVVPLPPIAEQKRIVEKLDIVLEQIDIIDRLQQQYESNLSVLKGKIIDAGIRGKLTEQLPEDGDAETLYLQIQEEKAKLIKEGKIKKEKPLPEIDADEIPFEIPNNWKWVRTKDIGSWSSGATPSRGNISYYENGTYPWIKTGELNDAYIDESEEYISELALKECSVRLNPIGTVLIAMYGATIGKVGILNIEATTNQACCACIPIKIYNRFLYYFLKSNKEKFLEASHGGAQPNISKDIITKSIMPLPPLAEQKRIVEKMDEMIKLI